MYIIFNKSEIVIYYIRNLEVVASSIACLITLARV